MKYENETSKVNQDYYKYNILPNSTGNIWSMFYHFGRVCSLQKLKSNSSRESRELKMSGRPAEKSLYLIFNAFRLVSLDML